MLILEGGPALPPMPEAADAPALEGRLGRGPAPFPKSSSSSSSPASRAAAAAGAGPGAGADAVGMVALTGADAAAGAGAAEAGGKVGGTAAGAGAAAPAGATDGRGLFAACRGLEREGGKQGRVKCVGRGCEERGRRKSGEDHPIAFTQPARPLTSLTRCTSSNNLFLSFSAHARAVMVKRRGGEGRRDVGQGVHARLPCSHR